MKKLSIHILINAGFLAALYFGIYKGVDGAMNIALAVAWLHILTGVLSFSEPVREVLRKTKRSFPLWLDASFDFLVFLVFVWFAYPITAVLYIMASIMIEEARKLKVAKTA